MTCYAPDHKLMFIHIPKTGGVSTSQWLIENAKGEWYKKNVHGSKHFDQNRIDKLLRSDNIDPLQLQFFTIVRNPWDRMVSTYHYYKKRGKMDVSFDEFIMGEWEKKWGCSTKQQHEYFDLQRTEVLRFERLGKDFDKIKTLVNSNVSLAKINVTSHSHYTQYYTPALKQVVAEKCKIDIERFGYTFD